MNRTIKFVTVAISTCGLIAAGFSVPSDAGERGVFSGRVPMAVDTTDAIMARSALFPSVGPPIVVPQGRPRPPFAGRSGMQFLGRIDAARGLSGHAGQLDTAFPGPSVNGLTPADPNLSVGPNHVICTINGRIQFYTKAGVNTFDASPGAFFSSLGGFYLIFDPRTYYDRTYNRFWVLYPAILTGAFDHSYYLVALSDDSDPNGAWTMWALDSSMDGSTLTTNWTDYPGIGGNDDTLLITANEYTSGFGWLYAKLRVMKKSDFLSGSSTISWTDIWSIPQPSGGILYSMQPARSYGVTSLAYVVTPGDPDRINVVSVSNPAAPTLTVKDIGVTGYTDPPNANQAGGTTMIWTIDTRVFDVHERDKHLTVSQPIDAGGVAGVRWYEFDATLMPSSFSLVQSGTMTTAARHQYFGNINMNGSGHIGAAFVGSGAAEFISIYRSGRLSTDGLGTMAAPSLVLAGTLHYTGENPGGTVRWGDYNGLVVDPADDLTFWGFQMIPNPAGNYWDTEVFSFDLGSGAKIGGKVNLDSYFGSTSGLQGVLEFRKPGTLTVVHSYPVTLDGFSEYSVYPVYVGHYNIALKMSHWLRVVKNNVNIAAGSNVLNFDQVNGDSTMDNKVALDDLNHEFINFTMVDPDGDLDGTGFVDLPDLNIVFINFAMTGDN